jgi:hypothetical protein
MSWRNALVVVRPATLIRLAPSRLAPVLAHQVKTRTIADSAELRQLIRRPCWRDRQKLWSTTILAAATWRVALNPRYRSTCRPEPSWQHCREAA